MIIRSILDDLIDENYGAMKVSSKIDVSKTVTQVSLYKKVATTRKWIESHVNTAIDLEQMATVAMLDKYRFIRLFKKMYGETPRQYLTRLRIARACELLTMSKDSVATICDEVGFESVQSFSLLFKKCTGHSPMKYRMAIADGEIANFR